MYRRNAQLTDLFAALAVRAFASGWGHVDRAPSSPLEDRHFSRALKDGKLARARLRRHRCVPGMFQ
jgi:hypothetical protein